MKKVILKWVVICALWVIFATLPPVFAQNKDTNYFPNKALNKQIDKEFPNFPSSYSGSGRFQEVGNPQNQLVSTYEFDMRQGVNHELSYYIDKKVLSYNVYDMNPSDGKNPDKEYFIQQDSNTKEITCKLNPTPLPNVFSRDWWLANNMVYEGTNQINGFAVDCWKGAIPGEEIPVQFCNRQELYPKFAPILKKLGTFEYYDYYGQSREKFSYPKNFFNLPKLCDGVNF